MRSALWLLAGIGVGFVVAHQLNQTTQGRAVFDEVNARVRQFGEGISTGYRSREAELREDAAVAP